MNSRGRRPRQFQTRVVDGAIRRAAGAEAGRGVRDAPPHVSWSTSDGHPGFHCDRRNGASALVVRGPNVGFSWSWSVARCRRRWTAWWWMSVVGPAATQRLFRRSTPASAWMCPRAALNLARARFPETRFMRGSRLEDLGADCERVKFCLLTDVLEHVRTIANSCRESWKHARRGRRFS